MPVTTFAAGTKIKSADVNSSFAACLLTDTARTVTVQHTFAAGALFASGSITASAPFVDASQTWNNGAVTFTALKVNVTDTASVSTAGAPSLLVDLQIGGVSLFQISKYGTVGIRNGAIRNCALSLTALSTPLSGDTTQTGIFAGTTLGSDCTLLGIALRGKIVTVAAAYTVTQAIGCYVQTPSIGAGSAITTSYAFYAETQAISGVTTAYAFYSSGTDMSSLGGPLAIRGSGSTATQRPGASTSVAGATTIYTLSSGAAIANVVVIGDSGAAGFMDVIGCIAGVSPVVLSSGTLYGAPAARTYSASSTAMKLAMAAGTYTVKTSPVEIA